MAQPKYRKIWSDKIGAMLALENAQNTRSTALWRTCPMKHFRKATSRWPPALLPSRVERAEGTKVIHGIKRRVPQSCCQEQTEIPNLIKQEKRETR
jgi:hypothetical protein